MKKILTVSLILLLPILSWSEEETNALDGKWVCDIGSGTYVYMFIGSDGTFEVSSYTNNVRTSFAEGDVLVKVLRKESSDYGNRMVGFLRVLSFGDYELYEHQYRYYYDQGILMVTPQGETESQRYLRVRK